MGEGFGIRIKRFLRQWRLYVLQLFAWIVFLLRDHYATELILRYGKTPFGKIVAVINSYLPKNITDWSLIILTASILVIVVYDFIDWGKKRNDKLEPAKESSNYSFSYLGKSPHETRRERDIENLKAFFSNVHIPSLYEYTDEAPRYRRPHLLIFADIFNELVKNPLFHIYDQTLRSYILGLHKSLNLSLSHYERYNANANDTLFVFANPGDMPLNKGQERDWNSILTATRALRRNLDATLGYVRENYLEIDITELSNEAWNKYVQYMKEG